MKWLQVLLFNTNIPIQHYSFIRTLLNAFKYCYVSLTIQLNISHLFARSLNDEQFYLAYRYDPTRWYHSRSECAQEQQQ